ncbi:unnamed protein product [Pseudo-nitzschia multistriata]|uniref:DUF3054 domain-containing protein n=1 Tax=Pseudo-nitzschia multistriata TaxID=183589 RepID=A0A448YV49_9STRA|nr:unnamed protein product [Pseudo-nitzschia multistriata]
MRQHPEPPHEQRRRRRPNAAGIFSAAALLSRTVLLLLAAGRSHALVARKAKRPAGLFAGCCGRRPVVGPCAFLPAVPGKIAPARALTERRLSDTDEGDAAPATANKEGVPRSPLDRPVLSAIDAGALLVFAAIGKASHSGPDGSLDLLAVGATAAPFLAAWFLVAPLAGSYTPDATRDAKEAAVRAARGWILAVPLGCLLRGIAKGYVPPLPFVVVTMVSTLFLLCLGRVGYTVLSELYVEMF